jgi:hypothetical protein
MERIPWCYCAALVLIASAGCANLEAKKVPLADRLTGKDEHIHGFRYYLSRPYIVVAQRVCVGQSLTVGRLRMVAKAQKGSPESDKLYIETIDLDGSSVVYDTHGRRLPAEERAKLELVDVVYPPPSPADVDTKAKQVGELPPPKKNGEATPPVKPAPTPPAQTLSLAALRKVVADETPIPTFQYVMLPDFEEQMAIKDCNFAAKGKYELKFADGWQLRSVSGSWDATEVAVKALQVLGHAVSAAADVRKEQLDKLPIKRATDPANVSNRTVLAVIVQARYIEPGIYRIQRYSERQQPLAGNEHNLDACCAILADLGFPEPPLEVNTYLVSD